MKREEILNKLNSVIKVNGHILVVSTGSGMTSRFAMDGGAQMILAINAGRFRQMGQTAFYSLLSCSNTNDMVRELGVREILPIIQDKCPVIAGTFMQDPCIELYDHLKDLKECGFSGVLNYPSATLLDGRIRDAMERAGLGYDKEVEGIRMAHFLDLFTVAYVADEDQAVRMVKAGADVICVYFGITGGGEMGAEHIISLDLAIRRADQIFKTVDKINPNVIKIVNGGPVETPIDAFAFYEDTDCQGVLAGSVIERIPVERAMKNTIAAFTSYGDFDNNNIVSRVLNRKEQDTDYAEFLIKYIEQNYHKTVRLKDLSIVTHLSVARLSNLFRERTGETFTHYLVNYRMEQARKLLAQSSMQIKEIGSSVGYDDYAQFSKMFKKTCGISPQAYRNQSGSS